MDPSRSVPASYMLGGKHWTMDTYMAAEDHPKFAEWLAAFKHRNQTEQRYRRAQMQGNRALAVDALRVEYAKAQLAYDKICDELD